jgi:glycosyltransferase involved in cell wall biosynthesis
MKVVHVTPFYAPVVGGVEEVVKRVAEYLAMRGYDVYVITYNRLRQGGAGSLPRYENINGVHVIRLRPDFTWSHGSYSSELPTVLRELRPDIVHVHVWRHPHVFQVAKLKRRLGFKAVLHGHAPFHKLSQLGLATWLYHKLIDRVVKKVIKLYDVYVALTPYEEYLISHWFKVQKEKIVIIPNGIDIPHLNSIINRNMEARFNKILYLGRISQDKNLLLLVKALLYIVKEVKDVQLLLVGPDEGELGRILNYANAKGVSHAIRYLGAMYGIKKFEFYASSAVFALPSLYEAFGITLLEAFSVGTPSVITGYGGQLYVAPPGVVSLWAKPEPKRFAYAIKTLLTDKTLWKKLSENALIWAKRFEWSKILPYYERLYKYELR